MKKMKFFILMQISKIGVSQKLIKKRFIEPHGFSLLSKTENKVKTVERAYALNKDKDECLLFNKKVIKEFKNKGYKFLHIGLIQVGIKPLTRRGINAAVLLRLFDGRFTDYRQGSS
jgi:hypothetical protein